MKNVIWCALVAVGFFQAPAAALQNILKKVKAASYGKSFATHKKEDCEKKLIIPKKTWGLLEIETGPTGSGKTTALIQGFLEEKYEISFGFKHILDKGRNPEYCNFFKTHSNLMYPCCSVKIPEDIFSAVMLDKKQKGWEITDNCRGFVGIDEGQFFPGKTMLALVKFLLEMRFRVRIAGLNLDFKDEPFETMMLLLPYADKIRVHKGICAVTGLPNANRTQRWEVGANGNEVPADYGSELIKIGDLKSNNEGVRYGSVNAACHEVPGKPHSPFGPRNKDDSNDQSVVNGYIRPCPWEITFGKLPDHTIGGSNH